MRLNYIVTPMAAGHRAVKLDHINSGSMKGLSRLEHHAAGMMAHFEVNRP